MIRRAVFVFVDGVTGCPNQTSSAWPARCRCSGRRVMMPRQEPAPLAAGEPAAAARLGRADRNVDRNRAGAIDRARNPAAAGR